MITDGHSDDGAATWAEAIDTREEDVDLVAVGVGSSVKLSELQGIASYPESGNVFAVESFSSLNEEGVILAIVDTVCNGGYTIRYHLCLEQAKNEITLCSP